MNIFFNTDGLKALDPQDEALAVSRGCVPLIGRMRDQPVGSILIGSTNEGDGWTGVYRKDADRQLLTRVARYRSFERTLRHALRLAA